MDPVKEKQDAHPEEEQIKLSESTAINGDSDTKAAGAGVLGFGFGERHKQCAVLFLSLTVAYSMRACMGVALVAMCHPRAHAQDHEQPGNGTQAVADASLHHLANGSDSDTGPFHTHGILNDLLLVPPYPKFWWSKKTQDTIQSSFFWGYMTLQIPGGWLAHRYGARRLLVGALACNACVSFVLPWAAYYGGWASTLVCRVVQGLSQACVVPSLNTVLGKWAPLEERSRMVGFVIGGMALGSVLGLPLTGFVAASPAGWPGVFRLYGLLAAATAVAAALLLADSPRQHPRISPEELRYIEGNLHTGDSQKPLRVPWARILTSRAVVAISLAHIAQSWGLLTLFSELPVYMASVMGVDIRANGMLTALPFLVMWFSNFFFNWLMDFIIVKKLLSVTHTRKLANSIGCLMPALGLVLLAYAPRNLIVVEGLLVGICLFKVASNVGYMTNNVDLSPNFAGTIASLSNFVANLAGSQAPLVAGLILKDPSDARQWRWVFFVSAALYVASNTVYVALGTAERAPWDAPLPAPLEPLEPLEPAAPPEALPLVPPGEPAAPPSPSAWRYRGARPSVASLHSLPGDNILAVN